MSEATVILAHGSRDPSWRHNIEAMAEALRAQRPGHTVACAYLELCAPNLDDVARDLVAQGVQRLCVLPLFFGIGKHAREDIPERLAAVERAHPQLRTQLLPAAGDDAGVRAAVVAMALSAAEAPRIMPADSSSSGPRQ